MRRSLFIALAVGAATAPMPVQARDVTRLQPSTPWNLHYDEDHCRLARRFGDGPQQVTLILDQFEPGEGFRMLIVGEPVQLRRDLWPIKVIRRFGPNEHETEESALEGTMGDKPALFLSGSQRLAALTEAEKGALEQARRNGTEFTPEPIGEAREAAVTWFEIREVFRTDIVLETGPMDKPLAMLRKCSWDTVADWGLDIEQQKTLTRRPRPKRSPEYWFHPSDYPASMLRDGHQGIINFRLMVDETGKLTSCKIQKSTKPKAFDDTVCRAVMKRARFEPALDAQGKPVPSYWRRTVQFRIR